MTKRNRNSEALDLAAVTGGERNQNSVDLCNATCHAQNQARRQTAQDFLGPRNYLNNYGN